MKSQIELYLGDELVEFSTDPQILMTYTAEDLTDPTAIKNNFSKTLTIEGTPNNNRIFGHYYDVTKVISTGFNPAKRVPFTLWNNGEKIETGYLKLDRVRRNQVVLPGQDFCSVFLKILMLRFFLLPSIPSPLVCGFLLFTLIF